MSPTTEHRNPTSPDSWFLDNVVFATTEYVSNGGVRMRTENSRVVAKYVNTDDSMLTYSILTYSRIHLARFQSTDSNVTVAYAWYQDFRAL